jgi:hypothetical protein
MSITHLFSPHPRARRRAPLLYCHVKKFSGEPLNHFIYYENPNTNYSISGIYMNYLNDDGDAPRGSLTFYHIYRFTN